MRGLDRACIIVSFSDCVLTNVEAGASSCYRDMFTDRWHCMVETTKILQAVSGVELVARRRTVVAGQEVSAFPWTS